MAGKIGVKYDREKLRVDLVPVSAIRALAQVLTDGARKYGERNWEKGLEWNRPYAAAQRHLLAWWNGETYDLESGHNHLWHALCELAFLVEFERTHPELDNRPNSGSPLSHPGQYIEVDDPKLVRTAVSESLHRFGTEVQQEPPDCSPQDLKTWDPNKNILPVPNWNKDFGDRG
jgi:hypothetical protein